jgi:hypothetical protein
MRLFNRLIRLAATLPVVIAPHGVSAGETSYYGGKPWGVVLHVPDEGQNDSPYCAIRTTLWDNKTISLEMLIDASGTKGVALRVEKSDWKLPLNQTTTVRLEIAPDIGTEIPMKAISEHELYYATPLPAADALNFNFVTIMGMITARQPQPLTAVFGGSEPRWGVPAMDRFQSIELDAAYGRCDVDIRGLPVSSTGSDGKATSPFGAAPRTAVPTVPSPSTGAARAPAWEFYTRNEDWGLTCFVQTHWGIAMVGFMGSPGKNRVGFVSSVFNGETRATWHVDDKQAYVSDGDQSDYFGWHEFDQLPMELLDQMAQGKELAITGAKGERVAVSLAGAAGPISKFKACVAKP